MTYARVVVCERLEDQPSRVPLDSEDAVGVQQAPAREQTAHPRNVKQLWTQSLFRDGHRVCHVSHFVAQTHRSWEGMPLGVC